MLAIVGMAIAPATIAKEGTSDIHWVGTWSASPQAASSPVEFKGQTIRQIVRVSIGGKRVRVRLSNAFGADRLVIGAVHVALRGTGAAIAPGSDRILTFGGSTSTTIPPGALAVSDPVNLQVPDLGDLAVSIHVPGNQVTAIPEHRNDRGEMAGTDCIGGCGRLYRGIFWNAAGQAVGLPGFPGTDSLYGPVHVMAHGINNLGHVVGGAKDGSLTHPTHAVLWQDPGAPPLDLG
ncbi:MAG TPA: hypothetical protein VK864_09720, partial [Longimicrobiales bacterium]|nr:hypothetical protein [Longimicrobiales bacterium]